MKGRQLGEYPQFFYWAYTAAPEVFLSKGTYLVSRTFLVRSAAGPTATYIRSSAGRLPSAPACAAGPTEVDLTPGNWFLMSDCVRTEP